jgi:hypothetical protein
MEIDNFARTTHTEKVLRSVESGDIATTRSLQLRNALENVSSCHVMYGSCDVKAQHGPLKWNVLDAIGLQLLRHIRLCRSSLHADVVSPQIMSGF